MKHKLSHPTTVTIVDSDVSACSLSGKVHCEAHNEILYKFEGTLSLEQIQNPMGID